MDIIAQLRIELDKAAQQVPRGPPQVLKPFATSLDRWSGVIDRRKCSLPCGRFLPEMPSFVLCQLG